MTGFTEIPRRTRTPEVSIHTTSVVQVHSTVVDHSSVFTDIVPWAQYPPTRSGRVHLAKSIDICNIRDTGIMYSSAINDRKWKYCTVYKAPRGQLVHLDDVKRIVQNMVV